MSDTFVEAPAEPAESRLAIFAAILLGLSATLTAISAYQAALLDGEALAGYTESNAALSDANFFYNQAVQVQAADQQLFVSFATASQEGQTELRDYLRTLMSPALSDAIDWWLETDDATTPFDELEGNPYAIDEIASGDAKQAESEKKYDDGAQADDQGDKFELATVLLALTLFFGGIATLFRRRPVSIALLGVATVALAAGTVQFVAAFAA